MASVRRPTKRGEKQFTILPHARRRETGILYTQIISVIPQHFVFCNAKSPNIWDLVRCGAE